MTTSTPFTEQSPSVAATRPQLRRSGTEKMLGGVCGGLAEYSGVDPLLWRVGALALAFSGVGVFVYLLLWVLMPPAPPGPADRTNVADRFVERLHTSLSGNRTTTGH